jgi:hypothetical protein
MPNPKEEHVLVKSIPGHVSWGNQILYTFPWRDEQRSTEEVDAYRFPYSPGTFWVNFRVSRFQENGILRTDGVRLRLVVRTASNEVVEILPWKVYYPPSWYSMRWPLPSLPYVEGVGIWLEMEHQESPRNQVDLQGFDGAYPKADRYVAIDEEDRHVMLFHQEQDVRVGRDGVEKEKEVASIHDLFDEDLPATHGVSPAEVDGVALFPLAQRR